MEKISYVGEITIKPLHILKGLPLLLYGPSVECIYFPFHMVKKTQITWFKCE